MVDGDLVATAALSFGIAFVYSYVAFRLYARTVSAPARLASVQFSLFWYGLGASAAIGAVEAALAAGGLLSLPAAITASVVGIGVDCLFLWAIVNFLIYVYTGRYHLIPVAGLYALFYLAALYYTVLQHPYAVAVHAGAPVLLDAPHEIPALVTAVDIGLVFPEFICAFLYLSLLRHARGASQQFRIAAVGFGIILWFGLTFFYPAPTAALALARGLLQLIPALLILVAYFPPAGLAARLGLTRTEPPQDGSAGDAPSGGRDER